MKHPLIYALLSLLFIGGAASAATPVNTKGGDGF